MQGHYGLPADCLQPIKTRSECRNSDNRNEDERAVDDPAAGFGDIFGFRFVVACSHTRF
tara:strand:- start:303 stop:479 length:177 start_codon:yes stop_codon:yes gene_type:complete